MKREIGQQSLESGATAIETEILYCVPMDISISTNGSKGGLKSLHVIVLLKKHDSMVNRKGSTVNANKFKLINY